jgi:hypothetical protein
MAERNIHSDAVGAWRAGRAGVLSCQELAGLYERALGALWRRAHLSLGEITLRAIMERVIHQGVEVFPHLAALKVGTSGIHFEELRQAAPALDLELLDESLAYLVAELLRVFGTLTGEILTPALHAELRKVQLLPADEKGGKA